ncbi:MAG: gliding motility-associated C-terminal domain-containing protein [Saprospiraceae bacterium]
MKKIHLFFAIFMMFLWINHAKSQADTVFINLSNIAGSPGDTVCISVSFKNFRNIQSAQWTMGFSPSKLEFVSMQKGALPGISASNNFFANNVSGTIRFLYDAPMGQTLPDDVTAFSLCFRIKGVANDFDCIRFQEIGINTEFTNINNDFLPFKYQSCNKINFVTSSLKPVRLSVDKGTVKKGKDICVPVRVFDFLQSTRFELDLNWDISTFSYVNLTGFDVRFAPQGAATAFYSVNSAAGILQVNWTASLAAVTNLSLPDSTVLFNICLKAIGEEGDISCVRIGSRIPNIQTAKSAGQNVGLNFSEGCIKIPAKIEPVKIWFCNENQSRKMKTGEEICFDIRVADFDTIGGMKGTLSWDPAVFEYVKYNNLNPPNGINNVSWSFNPDSANGFFAFLFESADYTSLPDSSVVFQLCLKSKGIAGNSQGIALTQIPVPSEAFNKESQGFDIGIVVAVDNCPVLVESEIKVSDTVLIQPNCKFPLGGKVNLEITGGKAPYNYQWSANAGSSTTKEASNLSTGIYYCTITDSATQPNLLVTVFDLAGDLTKPIAKAKTSGQLECKAGSFVALDGAGSSNGSFYSYQWISANGVIEGPDTLLTAKALSAFSYALKVTDRRNGCSDTSKVTIAPAIGAPIANAGGEIFVPCNFVTPVSLDGCGSTQVGTIFRWGSPNGGKVVSKFTDCAPLVVGRGTYILTVTLTQSGCTAVSKTNVISDANTPIAKAIVSDTLNCENATVTLDAIYSSTGAGVSYKWISIQNNKITNDTNIKAIVDKAGTYVLQVSNVLSCLAVDTITVYDFRQDSVSAIVVGTQRLNCDASPTFLDGKSSTTGQNVTYLWEVAPGSSGKILGGANTTSPSVDQAGRYTLTVRNKLSRCFSKADVNVLRANVPQGVDAGPDTLLNCYFSAARLRAVAPTGANYELKWTTQNGKINSGSNTLNPLVSKAGLYYFSVTDNTTKCSTVDSVRINEDLNRPVAKIIGVKEITCGADSTALYGMGSQGADLYYWTSSNGKFSGSTDAVSVFVKGAGTYQLKVQTKSNGCVDSVSHQVNFIFPEKGIAGNDTVLCSSTSITLTGTISGAVSGLWTSIDGAKLSTNTNNVTTVDSLYPGLNRFVWKLSAKGCPDFSIDTIAVFSERTPALKDDIFSNRNNGAAIPVAVLLNDDVNTSMIWKLEVVTPPLLGGLSTGNVKGILSYLPSPCYAGSQEFTYRVCSETCPVKCDTAKVKLNIVLDPNTCKDIEIPNTITPNGDGKNDFFRIDAIDYQPERFKNAELIVFNRWGDIVYKSGIPYGNNWAGVNSSGGDLPEGTYYYVLDLNLADGFSYRGDVTILK